MADRKILFRSGANVNELSPSADRARVIGLLSGAASVTLENSGGQTAVLGSSALTLSSGVGLTGSGAANITGFTDGTFSGDVAVNGGDLTTTSATFNFVNATATTVNIAGAATAVDIGASTGTTSVNNSLAVDGNVTLGDGSADTVTQNARWGSDLLFTDADRTIGWSSASNRTLTLDNAGTGALSAVVPGTTNQTDFGLTGSRWKQGWFQGDVTTAGNLVSGASITVNGTTNTISATGAMTLSTSSGGITIDSAGTTTLADAVTMSDDLAVNGGDLTSTATTFNLLNATVTTLNLGGAVTTLNAGAAASTFATGFSAVTSSQGTVALFNTTTTTLNVGGAATAMSIGNSAGTVTFPGDVAVNGGDITTTATTFNLVNATATTVNFAQAATSLVMGATTGESRIRNNARVLGNLIVEGTTTTVNSTQVLLDDNHLYLNNAYTTASGETGGLVVNYLPIATSTTVAAGGFTAGVAATSNPTVITTGSGTFSAGQFIQVSGASNSNNNGLFEVLTHSGTTLTIRGVGTTATVEDFTQNQFTTDATVAGTITRVTVSVMRAGTDGVWETGAGATTPVSFSDLSTSAASGWTDDGTVVRLTTATDVVAIGTATDLGAKVQIVGDTVGDPTLLVREVASQTADALQIQNSAGTTLLSVSAAGNVFFENADHTIGYNSASARILTFDNTGAGTLASIRPGTTAETDLGVTGTRFKDGWFSGDVTAAGNLVSGSTITVNGTTNTITGSTTISVVASAGALTLTGSSGVTTGSNFSQTGSTTFSTGTGTVTLNGNTTISGSNTFTTGTGLTTVSGSFTQSGSSTFSTGTGAVSLNGATTVTGTFTQSGSDSASSFTSDRLNVNSNATAGTPSTGTLVVGGAGATTVRRGVAKVTAASLFFYETDGTDTDVNSTVTVGNTANVTASYTNTLSIFGRNTSTDKTFSAAVGGSSTDVAFSASSLTTVTFTSLNLNFSSTSSSIRYGGTPNFFRRSDVDATQVGVDTSIAFAFPLMTTAERDALDVTGTSDGMVVWNTTTDTVDTYTGTAWVSLATSAAAGGWTDDGTVVRLTTSTDRVDIGNTGVTDAKERVTGTTAAHDVLRLVGAAAQTGDYLEIIDSAAADIFRINSAGNVTITGDAAINGGDLTSTATTFNLLNATVTTLNLGGAATSLSMGASTGTLTIGNATITATNATALNLNGASPSIATTSTTASVFNSTVTTLNMGAAATSFNVGAATGTFTIANPTITGSGATALNLNGASPSIGTTSTTANVFNTTVTTLNVGGAATSLNVGASTGTLTIGNVTITATNATALNLNGASPSISSTSAGTGSIFNTTITAINLGGAAATVTVGAAASTFALTGDTIAFAANAALKTIRPNAVVAGAGVAMSVIGGASPTGTAGAMNLTGGASSFASVGAVGGAAVITGGAQTVAGGGRGGAVTVTTGASTASAAGDLTLDIGASFVPGVAAINIGVNSGINIGAVNLGNAVGNPPVIIQSSVLRAATNDTTTLGTSSIGWSEIWLRNVADDETVNLNASTASSSGAEAVGFDPTGLLVVTATNVQDAIEQLDSAATNAGSVTFTASAAIDSGTFVRVTSNDNCQMAIATSEAAARVFGNAEMAIGSGSSGLITTGFGGLIENARLVNGLSPAANDEIFLSDATPGRATTTAPTSSGSVIKKVGIIKDASAYVTVTNPFVEAIFQPEPGTLIA